jgi:DNA methyltransferase 1-associated protein 1
MRGLPTIVRSRRFDLRWPVIHDRFPEGRTVEQLKERYYEMCRTLLAARAATPDGIDHPLAKFKFDAKHERERKAEFERLYNRTHEEVIEEMRRLEQAKALEAKMKAQKKQQSVKPGGRAAGLAALKQSLSSHGVSTNADLAVNGLPSLAGLMDAPCKHRNADVWLRSKDVSAKRPASEKLFNAFEQRMQDLHMPVRPLPTEVNLNLYNQCRAQTVLLVELEAKLEKLEQERQALLQRHAPQQQSQGGGHGGGGGGSRSHHTGAGQKRQRDGDHGGGGGGGGGSHAKRSHH